MNHNTGSPQDSHRSSESYLGELRSRAMRCAAFRLLDLFLSLASLAVLAALTIEVCIRLGGGFGSANALAALGATCVIAVLAFDAWGWRRNGLGRRSEARRLDCEVPGAHNRFETAWSFHIDRPRPVSGSQRTSSKPLRSGVVNNCTNNSPSA